LAEQYVVKGGVTELFDPKRIPLAKQGVAEELVEGELFLYDRNNGGVVHCLNGGAAIIWFLCDGTRNVAVMAAEIATISELPEQQILVEVQETVTQFRALDLLESW